MDPISGMSVATIVLAAAAAVIILGGFAFAIKCYVKVDQGQALIINKTTKEPEVTFTGGLVIPVFNRAEYMDISLKTVEIDRRGKEGLICADNIRADIKVTFFVRINKTAEDVLKVAQSVGCKRASDQDKIEELFVSKFSEALKTVGKQLEFESLYQERVHFRDKIIEIIGQDLNGYVLEDAAIDYLEQTPVENLDPQNILDAQGIRKITDLTSVQRVQTNEFSNKAKKDIGKDDLETKMALLEYERQEAEATAKQQREIGVVQAREKAEEAEITAKEEARAQKAHIQAQQEIEIQKINKQREEEVAQKNRERIIAVETENVEKERQLQVISRERETELQRIEKDKEVEVEKKNIAEIVRDRVSVDKTVAEEEERIQDLRVIADAERQKKAAVIAAEGEAEQALVKDIKEAEAQEAAAKHRAQQKVIEAEAELDASERTAKAKKQLAEGIEAEEAAAGLAKVRVKEADAQANEKQGLVDARVRKEQLLAEAAGEEEKGMVEIRLTEKRAEAIEKEGLAQAKVTREKAVAEAAGDQEKGLAQVRIKEAEADAIRKEGMARAEVRAQQGEADAKAIQDKLAAEAAGLTEKAEAMKNFDKEGYEFERFQMELDLQREISMEQLEKSIEIAKAQAAVLGDAFKASNINIVGGDDAFFDNFTKSITVGKMVEGFIDTSPTARKVLDQVMNKVSKDEEPEAPKASEPTASKADDVEEAVTDLTPGE
ncbi:flotillin family protein [Persicimonas caeni]|uniref:hypothetical protein n=1 Tax=Persicimonas caeni TaxID=2292766 RepID=UPI001580A850|nr:hypothetical protein [Persicimonas caeni]